MLTQQQPLPEHLELGSTLNTEELSHQCWGRELTGWAIRRLHRCCWPGLDPQLTWQALLFAYAEREEELGSLTQPATPWVSCRNGVNRAVTILCFSSSAAACVFPRKILCLPVFWKKELSSSFCLSKPKCMSYGGRWGTRHVCEKRWY